MKDGTEKYTHEFCVDGEEISIDLFVERDGCGKIIYWNFFINNVEEMSFDIASEYEAAFMSLLFSIGPRLMKSKEELSWLTIGGADYQLQKYQKIGKNNFNIIVDPLCGKLKSLFDIVDPEVKNLPTVNEIPLKFSDFYEKESSLHQKRHDVVVIDVSDFNEFSGFDAPKEAYTPEFYSQVISLTKKNGYIIAYEGTSDTLDSLANNISPLFNVDGIKELHRVSCGYGFMSLWEVQV